MVKSDIFLQSCQSRQCSFPLLLSVYYVLNTEHIAVHMEDKYGIYHRAVAPVSQSVSYTIVTVGSTQHAGRHGAGLLYLDR